MAPTFFPSLNFTRIYPDLLSLCLVGVMEQGNALFVSCTSARVKLSVPLTSSSFHESNWRIGILNSIIDYNRLPSEGNNSSGGGRSLGMAAVQQQDPSHFKCTVTVKEQAHGKKQESGDEKRAYLFTSVPMNIFKIQKPLNPIIRNPCCRGISKHIVIDVPTLPDSHSFHVPGPRVVYIIWESRVIAFQGNITPYRAHVHKRYSSMNLVPEHDFPTFFVLHRTKCKPMHFQ